MNVHYGDILVKFGEMISVQTDMLPHIVDDSIVNKYSSSLLQNGDIVIADAAEDETVGKCSEIADLSDEKVLAGLHTIPVRPKEKFACGYLGYCLNSNSYHDQLLPLMQGTKVSSISKSAIQDTTVFFPKSAEEQQQIGTYFRNLDNLITLHQRMEKVNLNPFFLSAWEQRKFGEVFVEYSEKNHDDLPPLTIIQGKGTILRDESDRNLIYDKSGLKNYKLVNENDFILHLRSFEGGLEKANSRGIVSPAYHIFNSGNTDPRFYYPFFRSKFFISVLLKPHVYGIRDGKSIDVEGMKSIDIPYPKIEEQNKIGDYFEALDNLITLHQRNKNSPPEQLHSVTVGRVSFRLSRCSSLL